MKDDFVKTCDPLVREYCPDRGNCPKFATFVVGNECDEFNQYVKGKLAQGNQMLSPFGARLKELMQADKEGRIVILPCPIGADVFAIIGSTCSRKTDENCIFICDGFDEKCEGYDGDRHVAKATFELEMLLEFGKRYFLTEEEARRELETWEKKGRKNE